MVFTILKVKENKVIERVPAVPRLAGALDEVGLSLNNLVLDQLFFF